MATSSWVGSGRSRARTSLGPSSRASVSGAVRVDSQTELVIAVDIAERLGISPQRVHVLVSGPGFPKPTGKLGRSAVWRWSTVEQWGAGDGQTSLPSVRVTGGAPAIAARESPFRDGDPFTRKSVAHPAETVARLIRGHRRATHD